MYDGGGQLVAEYTAFLVSNPAPTPQVSYLTQDHLGSTRVITNNLGQVIKRSDYMAYGDEVITANRSSANGYEQPSETRKGYTGYERDIESGLDFAQARYYNPNHGRFTSVDPLTASANLKDPQTFNRYTYALNSPYKFTDPLGLISSSTGACGSWCQNSGPNANEVDGTYVWFSDPHADRRDLVKELLRRHLARLQNREPRLIDEIEGTIQTPISQRYVPIPTTVEMGYLFVGVSAADQERRPGYISGNAQLVFTIKDQQGKPIELGRVTEIVKVDEGKKKVKTNDETIYLVRGAFGDFIDNGGVNTPGNRLATEEDISEWRPKIEDNDNIGDPQTATFTVETPNGTFEIVHRRQFTNVDQRFGSRFSPDSQFNSRFRVRSLAPITIKRIR